MAVIRGGLDLYRALLSRLADYIASVNTMDVHEKKIDYELKDSRDLERRGYTPFTACHSAKKAQFHHNTKARSRMCTSKVSSSRMRTRAI